MIRAWFLLWLLSPLASWAEPAPKVETLTIRLTTQGNQIAFDQTEIKVQAGRRIRIRFINEAKPGSEILHDLAILKPGSLDGVILDLQKSLYDVSKMSLNSSILALTRTLAPGDEEVLEFQPTAAGVYPYICLMAGHSDMLGMKGQIVVGP